MRKIFSILIFLFLFLFSSQNSLAINSPTSVPNNKFGIHIFDEKDLPDAAKLVNTNGDWGYVTIVIREDEMDKARWQKVFDEMRRSHLIPIVRIATIQNGGNWKIPKEEDIDNWVSFLNSLNWVVKNRYVIISNEPNHASEWGGVIFPEQYAAYLKTFSQKLKAGNEDYFVLPAGLDASANNQKTTMEESVFIRRMLKEVPDVFDFIDGWNSHSYPNPSFSGKETDIGKGTIKTYDWELNYLKTLGIIKNLPVFITETGWSKEKLTEEEIGNKYSYAFQNVWNDNRIIAVTPFILNYTNSPFKNFSWKRDDGSYHSFYQKVSDLPKTKGEPEQLIKGRIFGVFVNPIEIAGDSVAGILLAENLGQSIWIEKEVSIADESKIISVSTDGFDPIEPNHFKLLYFKFKAPDKEGIYKIPFILQVKDKSISNNYPVDISVEQKVAEAVKVNKVRLFDTIVLRLKGAVRLLMAKFKGL